MDMSADYRQPRPIRKAGQKSRLAGGLHMSRLCAQESSAPEENTWPHTGLAREGMESESGGSVNESIDAVRPVRIEDFRPIFGGFRR